MMQKEELIALIQKDINLVEKTKSNYLYLINKYYPIADLDSFLKGDHPNTVKKYMTVIIKKYLKGTSMYEQLQNTNLSLYIQKKDNLILNLSVPKYEDLVAKIIDQPIHKYHLILYTRLLTGCRIMTLNKNNIVYQEQVNQDEVFYLSNIKRELVAFVLPIQLPAYDKKILNAYKVWQSDLFKRIGIKTDQTFDVVRKSYIKMLHDVIGSNINYYEEMVFGHRKTVSKYYYKDTQMRLKATKELYEQLKKKKEWVDVWNALKSVSYYV